MSLLPNLLRQLLEYYGVPPELLLQRCGFFLNGIARMIASHLPSNNFSRRHVQQLCTISRNYLMSWAWKRKQYGSTRSFVRRLGKMLSLTHCPRLRFQLVQSLNLESEQCSTVSSVTPSLADVLWLANNAGAPSARTRYHEWRMVEPLPTITSSGALVRETQKATFVNEDAIRKISALEDELTHLRAQIATIVALHGARSYQSCSDRINSSNASFSRLPQPEVISPPVSLSTGNTVIPPPPPPPAALPSDIDPRNSAVELIKQRRAANKSRNILGSAKWHETKAVPSMIDVLKDINKVTLRAVERSPGGTPLPRIKKTIRSHWDPAAVIAEALKQKFASQRHDDSFDKENRSCDESPFSSPENHAIGHNVLKPVVKQTLSMAEDLMQVPATKARDHI